MPKSHFSSLPLEGINLSDYIRHKRLERLRADMQLLDVLLEQLRTQETSMHHFLEEYFARLGSVLHDMAQPMLMDDESGTPPLHTITKNVEWQSEMRSMYYSLAKRYHPDQGGSTEKMQALNTAYAQQSTGSMWSLLLSEDATAIENGTADEQTLHQWEKRLHHALAEAREQQHILLNSPAGQLWQQVMKARFEGVDLINKICQDMHLGIERAKRKESYKQLRLKLLAEA